MTGAIKSESHQVHDFVNTATHFFQIRLAPWKGAGSLAGGERERTPGILQETNAPRQGRRELLQPLPGWVSLFLFCPGVRFAHPRLISLRPVGAGNVTVVRQEPNVTPTSNAPGYDSHGRRT